ncbi:hypothetical protein [Erythrobacter crassostreae]|uniref:Uncharacterized protein n=1 Tax=Erythrobacter crassostreae TaxID=2828328 RepID=A0A9X1JJS8_9SPHN|nr:hypothetical protein [Erythrobacter crassostrea]MBV7258176.1 hypothetical protein [Erythrobacter crassostrea]
MTHTPCASSANALQSANAGHLLSSYFLVNRAAAVPAINTLGNTNIRLVPANTSGIGLKSDLNETIIDADRTVPPIKALPMVVHIKANPTSTVARLLTT